MSAVLWQLERLITWESSIGSIGELLLVIPAGIAAYVTALWFFNNEECRTVQQSVLSRITNK